MAVLSAAMVLGMSAGAAFAAPPTLTIIDFSQFEPFAEADWTAECGFPVDVEFEGHIIVHEFGGGRLVEIDNWRVTMTYSANGKSVFLVHPSSGQDIVWIAADGTLYEAATGHSTPHHGDGFIGRMVWNLDTDALVSSSGRTFDNPLDQLCVTLAA